MVRLLGPIKQPNYGIKDLLWLQENFKPKLRMNVLLVHPKVPQMKLKSHGKQDVTYKYTCLTVYILVFFRIFPLIQNVHYSILN